MFIVLVQDNHYVVVRKHLDGSRSYIAKFTKLNSARQLMLQLVQCYKEER